MHDAVVATGRLELVGAVDVVVEVLLELRVLETELLLEVTEVVELDVDVEQVPAQKSRIEL